MEGAQELEWLEAQKIVISKDLIAAAKRQLEFLAAVDRRRSLYDGPILEKAIHRYKTCWLPLLAKHSELGVLEDPLVVPFDCEWIWHCHRLNPVQYKKDCEEFYGRILDNQNVKSSLQGMPKSQTAETWAKLYPEEPYDLDYNTVLSDTHADLHARSETGITYDLVSAVKRQSSFYYQVSRPSMCDEIFLEGALARYRGFLQLIKRNLERSIKCFCVPTYDIDLIWHSHQLQPLSYCKDMLELLGKVLEHDDTDSDRTKGKKLDVGYSETTRQWEETYGSRYWRAGAMYRGSVPSPLKVTPYLSSYDANKVLISGKSQKLLPLPQTMVVEVLLEIVGIRNLPAEKNGNVFVSFSKKQPDMLFSGSCTLTIFSESGKKQVAGFECEPTGELVLALMTSSTSHMPLSKPAKTIGITSLPLADLLDPNSKLSVDKWFELKPQSGNVGSKPVYLHVAASCTVPVLAPLVFHIVKSHPLSMNTCFFPLPGKVQQTKGWAHFIDDNGNGIISLQMRNLKETDRKNNCVPKRKVFGVTSLSRKPQLLAECEENTWLLKNSNFSLYIEKKTNQEGHLIEVRGDRQIKLVQGKKLEFEPKSCSHIELGFITVVEFSTNNPYGKAMALFDMKSSLIMVNEEWFVFPGIILVFILSKVLKKDGYSVLEDDANNAKEMKNSKVETYNAGSTPLDPSDVSSMEAAPAEMKTTVKSGGCGSGCGGCGGGCGNTITTGEPGGCGSGCGGGCGGGCGSMVRSSGCGGCGAGGCGGGCGNAITTGEPGGCGSGCGGGCGGGCGSMVRSSGCGGCGAGGCGNMVAAEKSGGCGSGCGSCGAETNGHVANMGHGGELPIPA